jgi:hypothetical protein
MDNSTISQQQEGVTMVHAFTDQRSNSNKKEEPQQEEAGQGLKGGLLWEQMGWITSMVAKELVAVLEGRTWAIREEMRVQAAARRNTRLVEHAVAMPRRVAPECRQYYRFRRQWNRQPQCLGEWRLSVL